MEKKILNCKLICRNLYHVPNLAHCCVNKRALGHLFFLVECETDGSGQEFGYPTVQI
jgi:hypothetical protein